MEDGDVTVTAKSKVCHAERCIYDLVGVDCNTRLFVNLAEFGQ